MSEELNELRQEMQLSSLGDRPSSIAAHRLRRLIELEREHREARREIATPPNLDRLRARMAQFVTEVAPHDPTAYTIPFETYLQWEWRQQENAND
jgi:hypothetical protein